MEALAAFLVLVNHFTSCHGWTCTAAPRQFAVGQGMAVKTDKNSVFSLSGSSRSKSGSVPLKHVSVGPAGIWVDHDDRVYKFAADDFFPTFGQESDIIYCLVASSASSIKENNLNWNTLAGRLMYISCPYGCWGVDSAQHIFFTKVSPNTCGFSGWIRIDGAAVNVEVGSDGNVFVVNQPGNVFERTGISEKVPQGTSWKHIEFSVSMKHASCDLGRLWLVTQGGAPTNQQEVFISHNLFSSDDLFGTSEGDLEEFGSPV
ncbi:LOW QUALITY PROTEIN: fish-egg lectin-like [Anableps anableps]